MNVEASSAKPCSTASVNASVLIGSPGWRAAGSWLSRVGERVERKSVGHLMAVCGAASTSLANNNNSIFNGTSSAYSVDSTGRCTQFLEAFELDKCGVDAVWSVGGSFRDWCFNIPWSST
jgi:hypothetical protein